MPDERTSGVPAAPPAAPAAPPTPAQPPPGPVPYDRFSEVVNQRNTVQQEKARLEGQLQQYQQVVQQAQTIIAQQQQRPAAPAQPAPPASEATDPWEHILDEGLGTDEQGKEARRLMDIHAEQIFRKKGFVTKEEALQIAQQVAEQGNNKIATAFQVTNSFQSMVQRGVVTTEEAQALQGQLNQVLARQPELATQPHNVMYLAKGLFADAVNEGRIRPYSQPPPVNPLQAAGGGSAPQPGDTLAPLDTTALKGFRTLRDKSPDVIKRLTERSSRAHRGATS